MGVSISSLKSKRNQSSVLTAIEDIQKLSQDDIHAEFERIFEKSKLSGRPQGNNPCAQKSDQIIRCLHTYPDNSSKCFEFMESYQQCVCKTYQERSETFVANYKDEKPPILIQPKKEEKLIIAPKKKKHWYFLWLF